MSMWVVVTKIGDVTAWQDSAGEPQTPGPEGLTSFTGYRTGDLRVGTAIPYHLSYRMIRMKLAFRTYNLCLHFTHTCTYKKAYASAHHFQSTDLAYKSQRSPRSRRFMGSAHVYKSFVIPWVRVWILRKDIPTTLTLGVLPNLSRLNVLQNPVTVYSRVIIGCVCALADHWTQYEPYWKN